MKGGAENHTLETNNSAHENVVVDTLIMPDWKGMASSLFN